MAATCRWSGFGRWSCALARCQASNCHVEEHPHDANGFGAFRFYCLLGSGDGWPRTCAISPPSELPCTCACFHPTASITQIMSSMRSSRVGTPSKRRQTDAALVEHHARHEPPETFQGTPKQLMLPANLDVRDELRHDQTRWPDAPFVVGDAQTATTLA